MDVLTKTEYCGILALKKQLSNISEENINNELIIKYSQIDLRKRLELINTLYANIINNSYQSAEDIENAKTILSHLLISITDKQLEECLIVTEGDRYFDLEDEMGDNNR